MFLAVSRVVSLPRVLSGKLGIPSNEFSAHSPAWSRLSEDLPSSSVTLVDLETDVTLTGSWSYLSLYRERES